MKNLYLAGLVMLTVFVSSVESANKVTLGAGVPSSIKNIFVVGHAHLDIGFTKPPAVVAENYKTMIDNQIAFARTRQDYKWNIEETWQLEQWLKRSNQSEISELVAMVLAGQIGVMGGLNIGGGEILCLRLNLEIPAGFSANAECCKTTIHALQIPLRNRENAD